MSKAMTEKERERGREDALALVGWVGYRNRYFLTISLSLSFLLTSLSLFTAHCMKNRKEEEKSFSLLKLQCMCL